MGAAVASVYYHPYSNTKDNAVITQDWSQGESTGVSSMSYSQIENSLKDSYNLCSSNLLTSIYVFVASTSSIAGRFFITLAS